MGPLSDAGSTLLVIALLLCCSAFFSGTEVAMFSLRRVDREQLARSARRADSLLLRLLGQPRRLIATLLLGNEVVNISIAALMAGLGERIFRGYNEPTVAILTTLLTLPLLLCFGEITPKAVAIKRPLIWSRAATRPLWVFGVIVTPVRVIIRFVADQIARPFVGKDKGQAERAIGEAEFKALVDVGSTEGAVDAHERRLIHKVFEFGDKTVGQVMIPAKEVFGLAYDLPMARLIKEVAERGFSRVPIYHKSRDNIRGILYAKDLVLQGTGLTAPQRLGDLLHEPLFVPRTVPIERLFRIFKSKKTHLALVVNEYGKLLGLVTMEDLLQELFGEIRDEKQAHARRRAARAATPAPGVPITVGPAGEAEADDGAGEALDAAPARTPEDEP